MQLPAFAAGIGGNHRVDHLAWRFAFAQQVYAVDAVIGIDQRLRRDAADAG
jgi:hypothetical protein